MVEIKTRWTKENLKEYAKFIIFFKSKLNKISFIVIAALYLVVTVACVIIYFITELSFTLISALVFTLFFNLCGLVFAWMLRGFVNDTLKACENNEFDSVLISLQTIIICKDQQPIGELEWEKITNIYFNDRANTIYLCTKENSLLILEYKNIVIGTEQELKNTVKEKYDKLSKKA